MYDSQCFLRRFLLASISLLPQLLIGQTDPPGAWYLSFPLNSPCSANKPCRFINSVVDHSVPNGFYCANGANADKKTIGFTGEEGDLTNNSQSCASNNGLGLYPNKANTPGVIVLFDLNGLYRGGGGDRTTLSYDGHPGYDLRAASGDSILAAASGNIYIPITDTVNGSPGCFNTFAIDHGNGYQTFYLHSQSDFARDHHLAPGQPMHVDRGQLVGIVGNKNCNDPTMLPHLHFEVRHNVGDSLVPVDPYGWEGGCQDPYTAAFNTNLWSASGTEWNFDISKNRICLAPSHTNTTDGCRNIARVVSG